MARVLLTEFRPQEESQGSHVRLDAENDFVRSAALHPAKEYIAPGEVPDSNETRESAKPAGRGTV